MFPNILLVVVVGVHLCSASAGERLYAIMFSESGEFLVTGKPSKFDCGLLFLYYQMFYFFLGGEKGQVMIRTVHKYFFFLSFLYIHTCNSHPLLCSLKVIHRFSKRGTTIRSLACTPNEQVLTVLCLRCRCDLDPS